MKQLINLWRKDKDIRVVVTSVVEESSVAYIKMSRDYADNIFHLIS